MKNLFAINEKIILVTGSGQGIGRSLAENMAELGAFVYCFDIKFPNSIPKNLLKNLFHVKCDITNIKKFQKSCEKIFLKHQKIDVLINNAYFNPNQSKYSSVSFEKFPLELWNQVLAVNLTGVFLCSQEIGKTMVEQKNGIIVNISSIYGLLGADQRIYGKSNLNSPVSYAATKGAIINLTKYLAAYWSKKNIRVNTLSLGGVVNKSYMKKDFIKKYSEKTMLGRMANKEEYRGPLLFLASDASSYMTGSNLIVDGGWSAW